MNFLNVPRRHTLTEQTVSAIREAIASGYWQEYLPGERALSRHLQVSRPTLRLALDILQREGVISVNQGKLRKILKTVSDTTPPKTGAVLLISKVPLYSMSRNRIYVIDYLHRVLQENGLQLEIVANPSFGMNRPERSLRNLAARRDIKACILMQSSEKTQQWFAQTQFPTIVFGSVYHGVNLASIDCDYASTGRHAAGYFLGKGHRRLALLLPDTDHAGDLETEHAFLQYLKQSKEKHLEVTVQRFNGTSEELLEKTEQLLRSKKRPTAYFVLNASAAAALVTYFSAKGLSIPKDFSLISRDDDPLFLWLRPFISHYAYPLNNLATRLTKMVLEMVVTGPLHFNRTSVIPEFCALDSVASLTKEDRSGTC